MASSDYPYEVATGPCRYVDSKGITKISSYVEVPKKALKPFWKP
jgi:hypothetical protein